MNCVCVCVCVCVYFRFVPYELLTFRDRIPVGGENFLTRPDRPWGPPSLLHHGYRAFPGGKSAGVWRFPLTPPSAEVKERVELYIWIFVVCSRVCLCVT